MHKQKLPRFGITSSILALIALLLSLASVSSLTAATDPTSTPTTIPATEQPTTDPPTPSATLAATATAAPTNTPLPSPTMASPNATTAPATPTPTPPSSTALPTASAPTAAIPAAAPEQAGTIQLEIVKTLQGSDLVQVGEYLTFTIRIRNTGSVTITTLPLIDEYDPAVLQPALDRFQPAASSSSAGRIDWSDLTDLPGFGDLPPNEEFVVTTVFRAIGISNEVINRARVEAAVGSGGAGGGPTEGRDTGTVEGGRVIVTKALISNLVRPEAPVISFTISIRNEGAADLVNVPITDQYDPAYIRFEGANPAPSSHDPSTGTIRWSNILSSFGVDRLRPGEVLTATTSFAVLAPIDDLVVNRANASDVRDEFGNAVQAPRQADVRIRVIAGVAPTTTPQPAAPRERNTATPTSSTTTSTALVLTPTVQGSEATPADLGATAVGSTPEATSTTPAVLPATGRSGSDAGWLLLLLSLACFGAAVAARRRLP
ncbi:MAG: hypothetical protein OHK0050_17110 [Roseiflexaceae bacterium]